MAQRSDRATPGDDPADEREVRAAEREAARIGGDPVIHESDQAQRPVREAGGGEREGFEDAEELLIEHASHGDQQSAHAILHHRGQPEEAQAGEQEDAEADHHKSSEREEGGW